MRDVIYVAIVIGFFGLCAAYVSACARVVGGTQEAEAVPAGTGDAGDDVVGALASRGVDGPAVTR
jgi:hypothetical protein